VPAAAAGDDRVTRAGQRIEARVDSTEPTIHRLAADRPDGTPLLRAELPDGHTRAVTTAPPTEQSTRQTSGVEAPPDPPPPHDPPGGLVDAHVRVRGMFNPGRLRQARQSRPLVWLTAISEALPPNITTPLEVVPGLVELEVAVTRLKPASR
jgi:hypothetical protein